MQNVMPGGISIKETSSAGSPSQPKKTAAAKPKSKGGGSNPGVKTPNSVRRKVVENKTETNSKESENCTSEETNHITKVNKPPVRKAEGSPTKSSPTSPVKTPTLRKRPTGLTTSPSSPTKIFVRQSGSTLSPSSPRSTYSTKGLKTNTGISSPINRSPTHNRSSPSATTPKTISPSNSSPVSPQNKPSRYVPLHLRVKKSETVQSSSPVNPTKQTIRSPISESKAKVQSSRKPTATKASSANSGKKTEKQNNQKVTPVQEEIIKKDPESCNTTEPDESVKSSSLEPSDNLTEAQAKKAEKKRRQKLKKKEKEKSNKSLKTEGINCVDSVSEKPESNNDKLGIFFSSTSSENPPQECNETLTETTPTPVEPQPNLNSNPKTDINSIDDLPHETNLDKSDSQTDIELKPENSDSINEIEKTVDSNLATMADASIEKNRDEVKAAREAKKLAKQTAKKKLSTSDKKPSEDIKVVGDEQAVTEAVGTPQQNDTGVLGEQDNAQKTREQIKAEREAKKLAKQAKKKGKTEEESTGEVKPSTGKEEHSQQSGADSTAKQSKPKAVSGKSEDVKVDELCAKLENIHVSGNAEGKKKTLTKAERRALQEAQREAKAKTLADKQQPQTQHKDQPAKTERRQSKGQGARKRTPSRRRERTRSGGDKPTGDYKVKLFNHLHDKETQPNRFLNHSILHPAIVRLGEQYAKRTIVGSNARCISFLYALKSIIKDFETPPKQDFRRSLEESLAKSVSYLHDCRPLAVSITNAYKHMKYVFTQLEADHSESDLKEQLCESIDTYVRDQIEKAAEAISNSVQEKISNGDVILTFGCSSLINRIFTEAHRRGVDFRVILVDSRPFLEGHELLRRLVSKGIKCTCVLINALGFIMPEATKVLLGAHALLANGYVMARAGTAQVALVANEFNVPVLVCCETHKFSERVQTDAIVYNELGNPDDLIEDSHTKQKTIENWRALKKFSPVNLNYDVTPPELVTAVVTEVAILPCTSVPVILRIKPSESG